MQIDSTEIGRLVGATNHHGHLDRSAIAVVDATVIGAIAVYSLASVLNLLFA